MYHKRRFKSKIASPLLHWSIYCGVRDIHVVSIPFCSYQFGFKELFLSAIWGVVPTYRFYTFVFPCGYAYLLTAIPDGQPPCLLRPPLMGGHLVYYGHSPWSQLHHHSGLYFTNPCFAATFLLRITATISPPARKLTFVLRPGAPAHSIIMAQK